jgi:hypothetical protein
VFARGQPEGAPTAATHHQVDVIAFLWACLDLFGAAGEETGEEARYAPARCQPRRQLAHSRRRSPSPTAKKDSHRARLELGKQGEVCSNQTVKFGRFDVAAITSREDLEPSPA